MKKEWLIKPSQEAENRMDYTTYRFSIRDRIMILAAGAGVMAVIALLFYNDWRVMLFTPLCIYFLQKFQRKKLLENKRNQLMHQFQDAMQMVSNSLLSGSSIETAWMEAEQEMVTLYKDQADFCRELHQMNQSIGLNQPIERLLEEFAQRADLEDVTSFSEVFSYAKRSGGDLVGMIGTTLYHMRSKMEAEDEIAVLVASKKFEQNIMSVVPIGILAYLRITSGDYLDPLYGNVFGILFMSGCLLVYAASIALAEKILRIQV